MPNDKPWEDGQPISDALLELIRTGAAGRKHVDKVRELAAEIGLERLKAIVDVLVKDEPPQQAESPETASPASQEYRFSDPLAPPRHMSPQVEPPIPPAGLGPPPPPFRPGDRER